MHKKEWCYWPDRKQDARLNVLDVSHWSKMRTEGRRIRPYAQKQNHMYDGQRVGDSSKVRGSDLSVGNHWPMRGLPLGKSWPIRSSHIDKHRQSRAMRWGLQPLRPSVTYLTANNLTLHKSHCLNKSVRTWRVTGWFKHVAGEVYEGRVDNIAALSRFLQQTRKQCFRDQWPNCKTPLCTRNPIIS